MKMQRPKAGKILSKAIKVVDVFLFGAAGVGITENAQILAAPKDGAHNISTYCEMAINLL
jgi:replication-associated recombination protein RarA